MCLHTLIEDDSVRDWGMKMKRYWRRDEKNRENKEVLDHKLKHKREEMEEGDNRV